MGECSVDACSQGLHACCRGECNHRNNQGIFNQVLTILLFDQAQHLENKFLNNEFMRKPFKITINKSESRLDYCAQTLTYNANLSGRRTMSPQCIFTVVKCGN